MAEQISLTDKDAIPQDKELCKLCLKKTSRYRCPRCNVAYCTIDCYKCEAHLQCSELFYRQCFMEGLKDMQPTDREKVKDMLQRCQSDNQHVDDIDTDDLSDRIEGLDLDKDVSKVWELLTEKEKTDFELMLKEGQLGHLVELWTPWWRINTLVAEADIADNYPVLLQDIPDLSCLLKCEPSETVKYSVISVLYGYAYVCRLYNGDHHEQLVEACACLYELSVGLKPCNFESTKDAIHSCLNVLAQRSVKFSVSRSYSLAVIGDVIAIVNGKRGSPLVWVLAVLSDMHRMLQKARRIFDKRLKAKQMKDETQISLKSKKQCYFAACKKLEFYFSWVKKCGKSLVDLVHEIEEENCVLSNDLNSAVRKPQQLPTNPVVEELD